MTDKLPEETVTIIGAGLAGSLLAIYLAKRGCSVNVFEARGDMRKEQVAAGRSINLALSDRGIAALREVGMDEFMLKEAVSMHGRMIHDRSGQTKLLPYSGRQGEYINSVSRAGLNIALINEAEKYQNVNFVFNERCVDVDCKLGEVVFEDGRTFRGDTVIATDGAGSAVRQAIERQVNDFESTSSFLEHGYKELVIPETKTSSGTSFALDPHALHIWPRNQFMMIALPNFDGSFTCTLFLAQKNAEPCFEQLNDEHSVNEFFKSEFSDALPYMPTLTEDFLRNPIGQLGTMKCWPWNVGGKVLLLGDAAHAMVPFYGQGMNCAFEDVRVLNALLGKHGEDWEKVFNAYSEIRKPNTDAIQDMAVENFYEMRDATADPVFQRKRTLETKLEQTYPEYFSKYSMVTFRSDMPYFEAMQKGNAQDKLLMELCLKADNVEDIDLSQVFETVKNL